VRIAALYDIHGNVPALRAVLSEIGSVDVILVGGDVVWGPWPSETMDLLRSLPNVEFIMGNTDRDAFDRSTGKWKHANDWCAERLTDEQLAFLRSRPATFSIEGIFFCHGSPRCDTDTITIGTPEERILKWCEGVEEKTIVCGHTHAQFERTIERLRVVNPGSVGNPFGESGAYWAIFDTDFQLRFTLYDTVRVAQQIRASGFPYADRMARELTSPSTVEDAARWFESKSI